MDRYAIAGWISGLARLSRKIPFAVIVWKMDVFLIIELLALVAIF
jgi:hypothetical protein